MVYADGKAIFLWEDVAGGLGLALAVARAGRGRGARREIDQPLNVNRALEARTGTLGLEQAGGGKVELYVWLPAASYHEAAGWIWMLSSRHYTPHIL